MNKNLINILFYLIILVVCIISVIIKDEYTYLLSNNRTINNSISYNKYKNSKYVIFDMDNIDKTKFSIDRKDKEKIDIYLINIDNETILLELTSSTIIDSKIKLMKMRDDRLSSELKQIIKENDDISVADGYYTNKNISINEKYIIFKLLLTFVFMTISVSGIIINLFKRRESFN